MCCSSQKGAVIFAAVNSLIQSSVCIAFGIVTILMYQCTLYPKPIEISNPLIPQPLTAFSASFYLQYFHSQNNCIARQVDFWKDVNDTKTGVITKSYQVEGMFIGYLAVNSLWFICSFLLFVGLAIQSRWFYAMHTTSQFLVMIYDVILIVIFSLDFKSYREFLGNPNTPWITKDAMLVNIIVMLVIVSRFVFFFILNITTLVSIIQINNRLKKPKKAPPFKPELPATTPPKPAATGYSSHPPPAVSQQQQQRPTSGYAYPAPVVVHQQQYQQHPNNKDIGMRRYPDVVQHYPVNGPRKDEIIVSPTQYTQVITAGHHSSLAAPTRQPDPYTGRPVSGASPKRVTKSYESLGPQQQQQQYPNKRGPPPPPKPKVGKFPEEDYYSSTSSSSSDEDTVQYPPSNKSPPDDLGRQVSSSSSNIPLASAGGSRYGGLRRNSSESSSKGGSSEALKNQRPWSYINPGDLPSSPNKLNQFYNNLNAKNNERVSSSARALPSLADDEEPDDSSADYRAQKQSSSANHNKQNLRF